MNQRISVPLTVAALALAGALASMIFLERAASSALSRVQDERLRAAGESAAALLRTDRIDTALLGTLVASNNLDGAFLVDRSLHVLADSRGGAGGRVNLLRVDPRRITTAFAGSTATVSSYSFGDLEVGVGYFPVTDGGADVKAVLCLEAGQPFAGRRRQLLNAFLVGITLALITAFALAMLAAGWARTERARRAALARVVRGETMEHMAAIAAHEIRNPLGIIRGTVDLMRARAGADPSRDAAALDDIVAEVSRLRRLTDDLLELSANRPLSVTAVDLRAMLEEVAKASEAAFPAIHVVLQLVEVPSLTADAGRLRQVFLNLLTNAAEAQGSGDIELALSCDSENVTVSVHDNGPGIPAERRQRLFDGTTTKDSGTGLGLALSRHIIERHSGQLRLIDDKRAGATFEVVLPRVAPKA